MRTVTQNIYQFSELSEKAKRAAINELSDINTFYDWWTNIYEDAENIGLEIRSFDLYKEQIETKFTCPMREVVQNIIDNHGEKCESYIAARAYLTNLSEEGENEEAEEVFVEAIEQYYLNMLQTDLDYRHSGKAIIETIEASEYEFTADGKMYK